MGHETTLRFCALSSESKMDARICWVEGLVNIMGFFGWVGIATAGLVNAWT